MTIENVLFSQNWVLSPHGLFLNLVECGPKEPQNYPKSAPQGSKFLSEPTDPILKSLPISKQLNSWKALKYPWFSNVAPKSPRTQTPLFLQYPVNAARNAIKKIIVQINEPQSLRIASCKVKKQTWALYHNFFFSFFGILPTLVMGAQQAAV